MANSFSAQQIALAQYHDELVTYTWGPQSLPAGITTVFAVEGWNDQEYPEIICVLERLAATQNAAVQLRWTYDGTQSDQAQGWTDAFPSGMRWLRRNVPAVQRLSLAINNTTGAAVAGYQLNYAVRVRHMNVAEKLLRGYQPSPKDLEVAASIPVRAGDPSVIDQVRALVEKGTLPYSRQSTWDALYANRFGPDASNLVPRHVTVGATSTYAQFTLTPSRGAVLLITGLALEGAPAARLTLARDQQYVPNSGYVDVAGQAYVQVDDAPWPYEVYARNYAQATVYASPGTYPVRIEGHEIAPGTLLRRRLGLVTTGGVEAAKVRMGLR